MRWGALLVLTCLAVLAAKITVVSNLYQFPQQFEPTAQLAVIVLLSIVSLLASAGFILVARFRNDIKESQKRIELWEQSHNTGTLSLSEEGDSVLVAIQDEIMSRKRAIEALEAAIDGISYVQQEIDEVKHTSSQIEALTNNSVVQELERKVAVQIRQQKSERTATKEMV